MPWAWRVVASSCINDFFIRPFPGLLRETSRWRVVSVRGSSVQNAVAFSGSIELLLLSKPGWFVGFTNHPNPLHWRIGPDSGAWALRKCGGTGKGLGTHGALSRPDRATRGAAWRKQRLSDPGRKSTAPARRAIHRMPGRWWMWNPTG